MFDVESLIPELKTDVLYHARSVYCLFPVGPAMLEDLIGWGWVGVMQAAQRYDSQKSSFRNYAQFRIRGAMIDFLRMVDPVTRIYRAELKRTGGRIVTISIDRPDLSPKFQLTDKESIRAAEARAELEILIRLAKLDGRRRSILYDHFVYGISQAEIARKLKVNPSRVSQLILDIMTRLRAVAYPKRRRLRAVA